MWTRVRKCMHLPGMSVLVYLRVLALSEIDRVEQLLFYLIYLWFPMSEILIPAINQPLAMKEAERSVRRRDKAAACMCWSACVHAACRYSLVCACVCVCVSSSLQCELLIGAFLFFHSSLCWISCIDRPVSLIAAKRRGGKSVIPSTRWCAYRLTNKAPQSTFSWKRGKKRQTEGCWDSRYQLTNFLCLRVCLFFVCLSLQPATTSAQVCWSATWTVCTAS